MLEYAEAKSGTLKHHALGDGLESAGTFREGAKIKCPRSISSLCKPFTQLGINAVSTNFWAGGYDRNPFVDRIVWANLVVRGVIDIP